MPGLLDVLRGERGVLAQEQPQGLLGALSQTGAAPTYAQQLGSALQRLPSALFQPGYMQEPTSLAADLARKAFWRGSVMGVPEDVRQRDMGRAMDVALGMSVTKALPDDAMIPVFRGQSVHNKGGKFWTEDMEFARNFTQSGQDKEILSKSIRNGDVMDVSNNVFAGDVAAMDKAIAAARQAGYKAIKVSEGNGQPASIFMLDRAALR